MKAQWKYLTLTLVIGWFLGAASGVLIMRYWPAHHKHFEHMREHFFKELDLTSQQKTQVDAILQTSRQTLDGLFTETRTRVEEIRTMTRTQIRQLLTPAQQVIFDKLQVKLEAKHKKRLDDIGDHF